MKKIFLICLPLLLIQSTCKKEQITSMENTIIEYEEVSRGVYRACTIQDGHIVTITERGGKEQKKKISKNDLSILAELFMEIDVENLQNLKVSTEKASTDRSLFANLSVTKDMVNYKTQGFDHDTPPVEIAKFVSKLRQVANFF